jgi:hypothetical protein
LTVGRLLGTLRTDPKIPTMDVALPRCCLAWRVSTNDSPVGVCGFSVPLFVAIRTSFPATFSKPSRHDL